MLENWLRPLDTEKLKEASFLKHQIGGKINRFEQELPDLAKTKIALIGLEEDAANAIRKELYTLSFPFGRMKMADLGNARKTEAAFLIPMIKELLESKILPVLIGQSPNLINAQYGAHQNKQNSVNFLHIDERLPFHPKDDNPEHYFLNSILQNDSSNLFKFSALGGQSHFMDAPSILELERRNFNCHRLGKVRSDISELEPVLRDADLVSFHLSAVRQSDMPAVINPSPSGFYIEEACQLSRYAGMSDKLTSIGFYGYDLKKDATQQSAKGVAQLIWYFLDGFYNRKNDFPNSMTSLVEYVIDFKGHDYQISFWKSKKSGRWWLEVPSKIKRKHRRHRLIPCSYNDYLEAGKGDLPKKLLNALKRFE